MKKVLKSCLFMTMFFASVYGQNIETASYVNLRIGTGGHGHTNPAAVVPHGMVQPGPDTRHHGWDACSGYYDADTMLNGFSQTHLSGTGCSDLSDFLLMPFTGKADIRNIGDKEGVQHVSFASPFSHSDEEMRPGYYKVYLQRYGVDAEVTSTSRVAFYRFCYPKDADKGLIVDLDYNNQDQYLLDVDYEVVNDSVLNVYHRTLGWAYDQPVFAQLHFSQPFEYRLYTDTIVGKKRRFPVCKLVLDFKNSCADSLLVKVGLSFVDCAGAAKNIRKELPRWNFEETRTKAYQLWNDCLNKITINSLGDAAEDSTRRIFYTALYHANISPALFSDVDGRYLGMDGHIHKVDSSDPMYTVFSLWDTHRALHPLISIIEPERNEAYLRSLIRKGEEGGIVPKWELCGNYTGCMIGYHFASLLADMYTKGYTNYDVGKGYHQAIRAAEYDTSGITKLLPRWKMGEMMPRARYYKNELGYVPCDKERESVAKGLEYAYNDWCIAEVAKGLGDKKRERLFRKRAMNYKNYFDPTTNFMRGKTLKGEWRTPFDPCSSDHRMDDYTEGNAWQWTWFVPHDPQGLKTLFGSRDKLLVKLDSVFSSNSILTGENVSPDISGMIGQYAHGNEPGHHTLHLYNYMGRPHRTQELVDSVLYNLYADRPDGLSGNEDCGQMSAWFIMNAAGFYQFCPGRPVYSIGRPLFEEITFHLSNGRDFKVVSRNNSADNKYVHRAYLNGKRLTSPFFTHKQLMRGGTLLLEMGARQ